MPTIKTRVFESGDIEFTGDLNAPHPQMAGVTLCDVIELCDAATKQYVLAVCDSTKITFTRTTVDVISAEAFVEIIKMFVQKNFSGVDVEFVFA